MKKKDKVKTRKSSKIASSPRIGVENLTFRGIKRMAISMGMPFPDATSSDVNSLQTYIQQHLHINQDESLIVEYDKWMDKQLELAGYAEDDPMRHYQLKLSYISEEAMANAPKLGTKSKKVKEAKPPKEKDENGLWKGTKKSYTFELSRRGYSLERVIRRVTKKYPEANINSIKQWYKKSNKQANVND